MFMHEGKSLEDLVCYVSYGGLWEEFCAVLDHFIEVLLHILKDKVKLIVFSHHLSETHNVGML